MTDRAPLPYDFMPAVPSFELHSDDVTHGEQMSENHVFDGWGETGGNISPSLSWSGFPAETKSFAVTCYDPDAPTVSGFWHWAVADIPTSVTELASGAGTPGSPELPASAVTLANSAGFAGYVGAAPPEGHGAHRYFFVVHAVDVESLGLDASAKPEILGFNLHFHTLARAYLVPIFESQAA
jgi:Raf kinase inhibitor-like YbhB/YbcL family protein